MQFGLAWELGVGPPVTYRHDHRTSSQLIHLHTMAEGPGPGHYAVCSSLSKTNHWGKVILEKHQGDAIQL